MCLINFYMRSFVHVISSNFQMTSGQRQLKKIPFFFKQKNKNHWKTQSLNTKMTTTQGEKTRQALKGTNTNEIKRGLEHYLQDKRIESLFTGMTENLLLFQPDNPVLFFFSEFI